MNGIPDTRVSLLIRLPGGADLDAWREFSETYEPFVYRFARRRGLQDADAREVVQEVFLGVSRAVRDWDPDSHRARFRTWLFQIARHQLLSLLRRRRDLMLDSAGWNEVGAMLAEQPAGDATEQQAYRQEVFRWACARVQGSVKATTWNAFWESAVQGRSVDDVAADLQLTRGAIYVARSRVIKRLREEILRFDCECK